MPGLRNIFNREFGSDRPLRIIITRHGERADFALGRNWMKNIEKGVPDPRISHLTRRQNIREWQHDPPITAAGEKQAMAVGDKLRRFGFLIDYCYSSPAYRSIQTANAILESQRQKSVPISIEPGMFECASWYPDNPLPFIPPKYLAADRRFNINVNYVPWHDGINRYEDERKFLKRSRRLIRKIIENHKHTGGTVLLSGHGGSIEAVTRGMRGLLHRRSTPEHLLQEAMRVDYCNFAIIERDLNSGKWVVRSPEAISGPGVPLTQQSIIPLHALTKAGTTDPVQVIKPRQRKHPMHYHKPDPRAYHQHNQHNIYRNYQPHHHQ